MEPIQLTWKQRGELWLRLGVRAVLLVLALLALRFGVLPLLSWLSPFVLALVLSWMLNPLVRWLQKKLSISRGIITMTLLIVVVLLSFLFYFFKHPHQQQSQDRTRKKQRREEAKNSALDFTRTALRFENQQMNPPLRWRGGKKNNV